MLKKSTLTIAAAALALGLSGTGAFADECSGNDHSTGTVLGAIGGGLIGGFASHGNGLGIVGGALLGGLAGNAISRDMDCDDRPMRRVPITTVSPDLSAAAMIGIAARIAATSSPTANIIAAGAFAAILPRWFIARAVSSIATARPAAAGMANGNSCDVRLPSRVSGGSLAGAGLWAPRGSRAAWNLTPGHFGSQNVRTIRMLAAFSGVGAPAERIG